MQLDKILNRSGTYDLGRNATGVVDSKLHYCGMDDEYVIEDTMPKQFVQTCMDEVHAMSTTYRKRKHGDAGQLLGRIPLPLWHMWREEWKRTGKAHGVLWRAFLGQRIHDGDYKRFKIEKA